MQRRRRSVGSGSEEIDPAVVERIIGGDWRARATNAEKAEVARRYIGGGLGTTHALRLLTGWKVERYYRVEEPAA